jgi:hypothetical protein
MERSRSLPVSSILIQDCRGRWFPAHLIRNIRCWSYSLAGATLTKEMFLNHLTAEWTNLKARSMSSFASCARSSR